MTPAKFYRHGECILPQCKFWFGKLGGMGKSTAEERPESTVEGTLQRFDKKRSVTGRPLDFGWIRAAYADAVEYTRSPNDQRGMLFAIGIFGFVFFGGFGIAFLPEKNALTGHFYFSLLMVVTSYLFSFAFLLCAFHEFYGFIDAPVIFDRRRRKVYLAFAERLPGLKRLFAAGPISIAEYDWDLVDAEHNAILVAGGKTLVRRHTLNFLVRRSADDPTIIGGFEIGDAMSHTQDTVPPAWEHIRRFMEEGGPSLPPGHQIVISRPPVTLWQGVQRVLMGPKSFGEWIDTEFAHALIFVLFFPILGPVFFMWGIGNWLAHKKHRTFRWPQEVLEAIGPPIAGESAGGHLEK